jgi:hypothetical protein
MRQLNRASLMAERISGKVMTVFRWVLRKIRFAPRLGVVRNNVTLSR